MTPIEAADYSKEEPLPTTIPDDAETPRQRPPVNSALVKALARIETLKAERELWRARAHENSIHIERLKKQLAHTAATEGDSRG